MDKKHSDYIDRIKAFKGFSSDNSVAETLNLSRSAFSERKKRGSIPYEELSIFSEQEGLSLDWLLTGEGPMKRESKVSEELASYSVGDSELSEILQMLKESPQDKKLVLKLLKGKKDIKEALEGFEITNMKKQEGES